MTDDNNSDPKTINSDDQNTMAAAGVDLSGGSSEKIDEGEKEPEPEVVDIDSSASEDAAAKAGIKFMGPVITPDKTDLSSLAEKKAAQQPDDSKALEKEFHSEMDGLGIQSKTDSEKAVMEKAGSLGELLKKIDEKLGFKKAGVKEELGSLKKMKDSIGKDIEEIKELEESEKKIKEEIGKIEAIKKEVEEIEEKLEDELK